MVDVMVGEYEEVHRKASKTLNNMIDAFQIDRFFYEVDFECEYTLFEESLKHYCDSYAEFYMANDEEWEFFNSLKRIVETIVECDADMYDEDFFRPAELITYYLGKIISSNENLKEDIQDWLCDFCTEYDENMLVVDYFKPFLNGEKIYHADNYYTGYDDFKEMISVFK